MRSRHTEKDGSYWTWNILMFNYRNRINKVKKISRTYIKWSTVRFIRDKCILIPRYDRNPFPLCKNIKYKGFK